MRHRFIVGAALALAVVTPTLAASITPTFNTFGSLPAATFNGSGIPNDRVAITQSGGITLGLTATERFSNPPVGDDGAGTFFALGGLDAPNRARWNFDYYADVTGVIPGPTGAAPTLSWVLLYDLDPAAGTDEAALGRVVFSGITSPNTTQESWNNGFLFLRTGAPGVTPPTYALPFDPLVAGEYSFALIAQDAAGAELARSAILVNVAAVPEPSAYVLMLAGLGIVGFAARRRQRSAMQN